MMDTMMDELENDFGVAGNDGSLQEDNSDEVRSLSDTYSPTHYHHPATTIGAKETV